MKKQKIATTLRNLSNFTEIMHKYRLCKQGAGFTFTGTLTFALYTRQLTRYELNGKNHLFYMQ